MLVGHGGTCDKCPRTATFETTTSAGDVYLCPRHAALLREA